MTRAPASFFIYLTKWMPALPRVARVTGEARYVCGGIELPTRLAPEGYLAL